MKLADKERGIKQAKMIDAAPEGGGNKKPLIVVISRDKS